MGEHVHNGVLKRLFVGLALVSLPALSAEDSGTSAGVGFQVLNSADEKPVVGARVRLTRPGVTLERLNSSFGHTGRLIHGWATTDAQGWARFDAALPPEEVQVVVEAAGFQPYLQPLRVGEPVRLAAFGASTGRVVTKRGNRSPARR
jgi:hypothetical protein